MKLESAPELTRADREMELIPSAESSLEQETKLSKCKGQSRARQQTLSCKRAGPFGHQGQVARRWHVLLLYKKEPVRSLLLCSGEVTRLMPSGMDSSPDDLDMRIQDKL